MNANWIAHAYPLQQVQHTSDQQSRLPVTTSHRRLLMLNQQRQVASHPKLRIPFVIGIP